MSTRTAQTIVEKFGELAQALIETEMALAGVEDDAFTEDAAFTNDWLDNTIKARVTMALTSGATIYAAMDCNDPDFVFAVTLISPYTFGAEELDMVAFNTRYPQDKLEAQIEGEKERKFAPGENEGARTCELIVQYMDSAVANLDKNYIPFREDGPLAGIAAETLGKTGQDLQDELKSRFKTAITDGVATLKPLAERLQASCLRVATARKNNTPRP